MARSIGTHAKAGNLNLHGRRSVRLRCRCCTAHDIRDKQRAVDEYRIAREEEVDWGEDVGAEICGWEP